MYGKLPQLSRNLVALGACAAVGVLAATTSWAEPTTAEQAPSGQDSIVSASPGNQLVQAARTALLSRESVAARVRFRARMYGSDLAGSGIYLQQGRDDARRFRWELRMQVAGTTSTLVQVSDGRFLWTDRSLPSGPTVTRIDLRRIREAMGAKPPTTARRPSGPQLSMLATDPLHGGGLTRLMMSLAEEYTFAPPQQSELLDVPMFVVEGQLAGSATRSGGAVDNPQEHIKHLPQRIRLTLGRDDLFPYRLIYSAVPDITDTDEPITANGPALLIEWYDVQLNGPVDARRFLYSPPAESNWKDVTEEILSSKPNSTKKRG